MASTQEGFKATFVAAAATNLSAAANRGLAIALDANGDAVLATDATGDDTVGSLYDGGRAAGQPVSVVILGPALIQSGAAFDEMDLLMSNASSQWIQITAADDNVTAVSFQAAGAAATLISAVIVHGRAQAGTP